VKLLFNIHDPINIDPRSTTLTPQISMKKLMSLQNRGRGFGRSFKKGGKRRPKRNDLKKYAKKAAYGTGLGLAVSIPLTFAAKHFNMPELMEAGQRGGAIAASAVGGTAGQVGYQVFDAIADRFILSPQGGGLTGTREVYL